MDVQTKACDVCGRQKQETNHWFVAIIPGPRWDDNTGIAFGVPGAWVAEVTSESGLKKEDICGQECLHKRLSQWLESQTAPNSESVTA